MSCYILVIAGPGGLRAWACRSERIANEVLYRWVRRRWEDETLDEPMPRDRDDAIAAFFGESLVVYAIRKVKFVTMDNVDEAI